jgi:hypothetical protein
MSTTTTLRSSEGYYVCAESGGGKYAVADRPSAGPWETWGVELNDDGTVSLIAHNGMYLCAEVDGKTVNANRGGNGPWERFTYEVRDNSIVAFKTHHGTWLQAPLGGGANSQIVQTTNHPGEWEFFTSSTKFWETSAPGGVCRRPLVGPLRVESKLFRDDTGFRRVFFCSWFPALRILRDDPTEFWRQLDGIVAAGYQGIRVFLAVGGWDDYWNGREVAPKTFVKWLWTGNHLRTDAYSYTVEAWPDYDELLRTLLRACKERKLRLHVTTGDMQCICPDPNEEIDLHRRFARICAEEGGTDVIALAETTNEFPLNRYGGGSDDSINQMGRVLDVWSAAIPGVITATGAILSEEPDELYRSVRYGTACATHTSRDPFSLCLKRTFGLVYWEGEYRHFSHPYWQGEPAGPGEDSYARQDDPANLVALYAMHALTGQASNRFQGAGVRSFVPLESEWGFTELPALFDAHLPEDIALWEHGSNHHGGIEYWWKGNDFRTAVYADWDPTPPRPIKEWTLYTGTSVHSGTGPPAKGNPRQRGTARGTGLLVGTFA